MNLSGIHPNQNSGAKLHKLNKMNSEALELLTSYKKSDKLRINLWFYFCKTFEVFIID